MLQLLVKQEKDICTFELSWGGGQRLSRDLPFSEGLRSLYQEWQHAYLSYYQTVRVPLTVAPEPGELRGKAAGGGSLTTPVDWHARLVEAETRLLYEFHRWLRQGELFALYEAIADFSRNLPPETPFIDIFLTCHPLELARLPWEAWELGAAFATNRRIRIARTPLNIRNETVKAAQKQRRRPRILVILGSDPNQNFEGDWQQLRRSLKGIAELPERPIGWRPEPGQDLSQGIPREQIDRLKDQIKTALVDPLGWDVLFFAGHSNENQMMGGELGIAPGVSIRISEMAPQVAIAKERGLQFALFNSCSGLSVAESLIDLGLSQVAVMREPVHNRVAQEFLVQFIPALAKYEDVHEALLAACQYLKTEKNLTHPSAHLIPSLFRHPEATLFRIQPSDWRQQLKRLLPRRYEAIALTALLLLSWQGPVQQWLLDRRVLTQTYYREIREPTQTATVPPILLVRIDNESIKQLMREMNTSQINPIHQGYLGNLLRQLSTHQPQLVGVDYLLDRAQPSTKQLEQSVREAKGQGIQFVFAADFQDGKWEQALPEIANNSLPGDMGLITNGYVAYVGLPHPEDNPKPFSYVLSTLKKGETQQIQQSPLTALSYNLGQRWLDPIIDYSLPPEQIYSAIPAWKLMQSNHPPELRNLSQQVVLIVPGGYAEAGMGAEQTDTFPAPLAMQHWYRQENLQGVYRKMTGGEIHAYKLHHLLRQRLVIPVPDIWMILLAAVVGKALVSLSQNRSKQWIIGVLIGGTGFYAILSLELYFSSAAVLLPIVLPAAVVWLYVVPSLVKKHL